MSATDQSSITSVADEISTALQSSDEQTASSLQTLSLVHQARTSQLTRYTAAVTTHFGSGSPEATTAQTAVTASQALAVRSDVVNRQLSTAAPIVPAGGWVLHGRVYDAQAGPVAAQTVFLADQQSAFQSEYGFAYTDDTGYFALTADAPDTSSPAVVSTPALYLAVSNQKRQPVYFNSTSFEPTPDTATYMNIYLGAGDLPLGAPPRGASALPPAPRSAKRRSGKSGSSTT